MKVAITVVVLIAVTLVSAGSPPVWPDQYYVKGTFNIPYFEIVEPIELNFDAKNNREAFSYYNEMDTYIWRFDTQTLYQIIPRIDTLMCFTSNGIGNGPMVTLLPDLSDWTYIGQKFKDNIKCDVFQKVVTNFNRTDTFKMYTTSAGGQPYELHINGYDFVFGSHPDIYIMKYEVFKPNWVNETAFNPPSLCNNAKPSTKNSMYRARSILARSGLVVPQKQSEDHFDHFVAKYKKVYHTEEEYQHRRGIYEKNLKYIKEHNERTDVTHTLGMNHYGDLTQDEVRAILYPKSAPGSRLAASSGADYIHKSSGRQVPSSIDWRTLGAVNPPKDQGVCGSCWTFGTTGAIEGAWFVKTGNLVSLSEQQIVDCAWGTWIQGNSGCDGGFAGPAFEWIMQNNGIALEQTYKYLMMDHYCNAYDVSSGVTLKGYVNVTSGSEDDLVDALASVGPVTVAIDASHPSFTYYLSGVYYEPECKNDIDDLDHQVLAVGYGSENGQDYWIVKNSWSTHWGDQGFVKMARNRNNNCGVATQAQYVLV